MTSAPSEHEPDAVQGPKLTRYGIAGFLTVGLGVAIILGVLVSAQRGTSAPNVEEALRAAGCTLQVVDADEPGEHLQTLDAEVEHNTFPPTNGRHYEFPAPWGFFGVPVNQLHTVHNLEHGGIVMQYGDPVSDSDFAALGALYKRDSNALLVAPLPELGAQFALGAWTALPESERARGDFGKGHLALCPRFDDDAFTAFRDAYRYQGPERYDPRFLAPDFPEPRRFVSP